MTTKIEWADATINPVVGCSHCSPGCENCFAERFAARMVKHPNPKISGKYAGVVDEHGKWTGKINLHMDGCLHAASVTRKPKRFFIGSMTDIFHENIPDEEIRNLFLSMTIVPNDLPTYMVLTKRPQRAKAILEDMLVTCPELHRVWLGVTVCNQAEADAKIPVLLQTPAAVRFLSVEPMLGPVNFCLEDLGGQTWDTLRGGITAESPGLGIVTGYQATPHIDWVICGGETGPGARAMHPDWVRGVRDQCQVADVPFFFKNWGEWLPCSQCADEDPHIERLSYSAPYTEIGNDGIMDMDIGEGVICRNGVSTEQIFRVGKRRAGRLLDGRTWDEFPEESC